MIPSGFLKLAQWVRHLFLEQRSIANLVIPFSALF